MTFENERVGFLALVAGLGLLVGCAAGGGAEVASTGSKAEALQSSLRGVIECGRLQSDACKDVAGEELFRGLFFGEGAAASPARAALGGAHRSFDTQRLDERLAALATARAAYCATSSCIEPEALGQPSASELLVALAARVSQQPLAPAAPPLDAKALLASLDEPSIAARMRAVTPSTFIDFADHLTSGDAFEVSLGLRDATDALLYALLPTAADDPVQKAATLIAALGEDPYVRVANLEVIQDLASAYAALLPEPSSK